MSSRRRQSGKIEHSIEDLVRQRLFGIACSYSDGNDAARLTDDPMHKLLLDRDPISGAALASQPTLSRFENAPRGVVSDGRSAHRECDRTASASATAVGGVSA